MCEDVFQQDVAGVHSICWWIAALEIACSPAARCPPPVLLQPCTGFEGLERVPSMFVLMGNFQSFACSSASTDYAAIRDNFGALAALLASFPRIAVSGAAFCTSCS